jgi:predicted DNA binding CopG/RHH family protein
MKKKIPAFRTDEEAEAFVDSADLSEYDLSGFRPVQFEFQKKEAQINMRIPQSLLDAVKTRARARGVPYTRYIRQLLEQDVTRR